MSHFSAANVADVHARLPLREGLSASRLGLPPGQWPSLLAFLLHRFPGQDEAVWRERMRNGTLLDQTGVPICGDRPFSPGQIIFYYRSNSVEAPIPGGVPILYRDERLLVADKPHFLPTVPSGVYVTQTLLARLRLQTGLTQLSPLHRLDADTAGVVVCCIDPVLRGSYQQLFAQRAVEKVYEAQVDTAALPAQLVEQGRMSRRSRIERGDPFFISCETSVSESDANASTVIELAQRGIRASLLRLFPETGKKHQLRVHLCALGMPILHDRLYPVLRPRAPDDFSEPLQLLARKLAMTDPHTGERLEFVSQRSLKDIDDS
jgi:tRNA pseudouridine32 synthase/23S rRNA pseudouridine746 synthase